MKNMRTSFLVAVVLVAMMLQATVMAEATRGGEPICDQWMSKRVTVGSGADGASVDFSDTSTATGWSSASTAHIVVIKNRDAVDTLLWDEFTYGESVTHTELETPSADVASQVDRIAPGVRVDYSGIAWIGVDLQNEDDVSDDQDDIIVDVKWCY